MTNANQPLDRSQRRLIGLALLLVLVIVTGGLAACSSADDDEVSGRQRDATDQPSGQNSGIEVVEGMAASDIDTGLIWESVTGRVLLDAGRYEQAVDLGAERKPKALGVVETTHRMRMRGVVQVTLGINLASFEVGDIVIDKGARTVTIALPSVQPVECYLEQIEYYDQSCAFDQCERLESDLREKALDAVFSGDGLAAAQEWAFESSFEPLSELIMPLVPAAYRLQFVLRERPAEPIPNSSCPAPSS